MPNRFKTALDIQDACNLTAVVGVLHKTCLEVLEETHSTRAVAQDPAIIWMVDKVNDLIGRPDCKEMTDAYLACHDKSEVNMEDRRAYSRG